MITNYGIYNNHELDNTLLVLVSDKKSNKIDSLSEEMEVLYCDNELVGYRIRNFIRYAKIKYTGIIFLPADPLIDVINLILERYKLEELAYKVGSGYITKEKEGKMSVYALEGTFLKDQTISKGKYCTYHDLYIENENEDKIIEIEDKVKEFIDFFMAEVK